jgi:hypothetical protein
LKKTNLIETKTGEATASSVFRYGFFSIYFRNAINTYVDNCWGKVKNWLNEWVFFYQKRVK